MSISSDDALSVCFFHGQSLRHGEREEINVVGYVYLTLAKNIPVLSAGKDNYETEQECQLAHAGRDENPFWCVPSNWLDEGQRRAVRAFVTD
jgi:hypothetical protein